MAARGVIFRLNARLTNFQPGFVALSDGEIPAETLVWTAGTSPNPLLRNLAVERDKRGAVIVETTLAIKDHPGVNRRRGLRHCGSALGALIYPIRPFES